MLCREYNYPKKAAPSFYQVTNNSKERPDVWVDSPERSIILSITSDIRTIRSETFAAPYSLRFPRIDRARYDKSWHECLDVQSFIELVHSSNGTIQREADHGDVQDDKPKRLKALRKGERNISIVPSHFIHTDVSHIKWETLIFSNMVFYFVNLPPNNSLDSLHRLVAENGGTSSMNLNNTVTHCIAAESKGIKFQAAKLRGDIIHYSWLFDCCSQKKILPLKPKYFLHLSELSKKKLQEEIDEFSDSYYWDIDIVDFKQLLNNIDRPEDSKTVDYYKKKYCPKDKWSRFHGCCIYFHLSIQSLNLDWKALLELEQRRMKLEVYMGGGMVSNNLSHATHLVVLSLRGSIVDFDAALNSLSAAEMHLIRNKMMHVVGSQWLEDCIEKNQRLREDTYSIKLKGLEDSAVGECTYELKLEDQSNLDDLQKQNILHSLDKDEQHRKLKATAVFSVASSENDRVRRRGKPTSSTRTNKRKLGVIQPRRTRARVGNKPAKIYENESDVNTSSDETTVKEESEMGRRVHEISGLVDKESPKVPENEMVENSVSSQSGKVIEQKNAEDSKQGEWIDRVHGTCLAGTISNRENEKLEKLEVMVDPVQAMLLDMIPSLGTQKVESTSTALESEEQPSDPNPVPVKKKKVSYKDIACDLLKDW